MKRTIITLVTTAVFATVSMASHTTPITDFFRTIILINGTPFLVEMDNDGNLLKNISVVSDYFETNESHENLVRKASDVYEEELARLDNSRLIIFEEENSILNNVAINNIRDLATKYNQGLLQNIRLTAGQTQSLGDESLTGYRVQAIFQMLVDFGVEATDISADFKVYKSELPNQFVKIDLLK